MGGGLAGGLGLRLVLQLPGDLAVDIIQGPALLHADALADDATDYGQRQARIPQTRYNDRQQQARQRTEPDAQLLKPYLPYLDMVLVMSVEPGFGGQSFMDNSIPKISELKRLREENDYNYLISVDGGINNKTIKLVANAGVDVAVVGSYLFKQTNKEEEIEKLSLN